MVFPVIKQVTELAEKRRRIVESLGDYKLHQSRESVMQATFPDANNPTKLTFPEVFVMLVQPILNSTVAVNFSQ
jgi:hypothetical protein